MLKEAATELLFKAMRTVVTGQYWVGRDTVTDIVRHMRERAEAARREPSPADRLTPREREIVAGVAGGESNREVARRLGLSEDTVKHHLTNVFDKVGVSKRGRAHGVCPEPRVGRRFAGRRCGPREIELILGVPLSAPRWYFLVAPVASPSPGV